jgi:hypothetical protein
VFSSSKYAESRLDALSLQMNFLFLWKRQCDSGKESSVGLDARVVNVCVEMSEILVKQVCRAYCEETVPFRKAVADGGIE